MRIFYYILYWDNIYNFCQATTNHYFFYYFFFSLVFDFLHFVLIPFLFLSLLLGCAEKTLAPTEVDPNKSIAVIAKAISDLPKILAKDPNEGMGACTPRPIKDR